MDSSLIGGLLGQLQGAHTNQIAQQLGTDPATAQNAIAAALPLIVGTLSHHAQQPGGASALLQALQQNNPSAQGTPDDSDTSNQGQSGGLGGMIGNLLGSLTGGQQGQGGALGGLGGLLGAVLGGGAGQSNPQLNAGGILGQIFGNAQSHAQNSLGQATGLGTEQAGQLLTMLAPIVMSHLANHASTNNLDAAGLSTALAQEQSNVQNQGGIAGNLLGAVLSRI
jgi:hypothetical protein